MSSDAKETLIQVDFIIFLNVLIPWSIYDSPTEILYSIYKLI